MGKIFSRTISGVLLLVGSSTLLAAEKVIKLEGSQVRIEWKNSDLGWQIAEAAVASNKAWLSIGEGCGSYTYLYATKVSKPLVPIDYGHSACTFYPKNAAASDKGVAFSDSTPEAEITSEWCIDEKLPSHIRVKLRLVAKKEGYYSLSTPSLTAIDQAELAWGMIPGAWYGRKLQPDRELALAYSQGIPDRPALSFEANTMTLCGIMSSRNGVTLGVAPEPGTAADPWPGDSMDRDTKQVGISLMDRHMRLGPVLYYPIHGERKSYLKAGESVELAFRFILAKSDWFPVYKSVAEDMYHFSDLLPLQQSEQSLAERVERMQTMLVNPQEACWNTLTLDNTEIGMYGSKNSDLGAMLMLAKTSPQSATFNSRMPLVRAFKLEQQEMTAGFFQGAAVGEYPVNPATGMAGDGKFVSEVGNWVEPLYTTIYTLCDVGNMLLFNPGDTLLRDRVRAAGDRLLAWQHPDGGFDVAYDRVTHALVFPHLKDYRPTWYGLLVAHRILGDPKYLAAARRGADWFVTNAVNQGYFLGACGDSLNKWDFTTAQSAQALLDLYETTKDLKYRDAAVRTAELYATSIFTHPVASAAVKMVNGTARQDWEITQTGLGVEHIRGTAAASGPIYLASHAGLFVRIFHLTGEKLFLDMARAAARGRSAAADSRTGEAIYYWRFLSDVNHYAVEFPWHAWWQIGWITDYLMAELELRSNGQIVFPRGFVTPKVGPHESYGFAPGLISGDPAELSHATGAIKCDDPNVEYVTFRASAGDKAYVAFLNQRDRPVVAHVSIDVGRLGFADLRKARRVALEGKPLSPSDHQYSIQMSAWGYTVLVLE